MSGEHALVVGGSGMLAGLCRRLAASGWEVTVVGRNAAKLACATARDPRLHPLSVDYEDVEAFAAVLASATAARGPFTLAVCWIRSWAPRALLASADALPPGGRLLHVLGSQGSDASATAMAELERREGLDYRQVQLGAFVDDGRRRWLTAEEISAGVYAALVADRSYLLVGTEP